MRHLLRRLYPDELLGSFWVSTAKRTGLAIGQLTMALIGRKTAPGFFQAGHLNQVATLLGTTGDDLLRHHTVVPYAVSFYPEAARQNALAGALEIGQAAVAMGAVTQSVSDFSPYRRWCPKCCLQEWRELGQTYWHRSHNLPGVFVCVKHRVPLRVSQLRTTGRTSWEYILPQDDTSAKRVHSRCEFPLLQLAKRSAALLAIGEHTQAPQAKFYRERLVQRGLLSANRDINVERLKALVRSVFRDDVERLGLRESDVSLDWTALMVRPGTNLTYPPIKHLMLHTAIDLADASHKVDHVPSGMGARYGQEHDRQFAQALQTATDQHLLAGSKIGVKQALIQVGAWSQYRHDRQRYPELDAQVRRLRRSKAALRRQRRKMRSCL